MAAFRNSKRDAGANSNRPACLTRSLVALAVAAALLPVPRSGWANPRGGSVASGSAAISQTAPNRVDIVQSTDKAVINWRGFDVAAGERTHFQQPGAGSVTLNRINSIDASRINGRLTANGQLMLVNPNGVFFGPNSRVDVAGLVATTSDITDDNFMAGRYRFDLASPDTAAVISALGEIRASDGGFVVLSAPQVSNSGVIDARLGSVVLAGAQSFTLDFHGDGLVQYEIGQAVVSAPQDDVALVSNSGRISADGGRVVLSANTAGLVVDRVINMDGVIQAQSISTRNGEIILSGGFDGTVAVSGELDASGGGTDETGGRISVLGDRVGLLEGARVDARGSRGGGEVLLGGNYHGEGPEQNARVAYVHPDARIAVDATTNGDGGRAIVWSDDRTGFFGAASATGGTEGGNGGFVEISSAGDLSFAGRVDVSAENGQAGGILLDPDSITITAGGPDSDDVQLADGEYLSGDPPSGSGAFVSEDAIEALVGDVRMEATGDIFVESGLLGGGLVFQGGSGSQIDIVAGTDIIFNSPVTVDQGALSLVAGGDIRFNESVTLNDGSLYAQAFDSIYVDAPISLEVGATDEAVLVAGDNIWVSASITVADDLAPFETLFGGLLLLAAESSDVKPADDFGVLGFNAGVTLTAGDIRLTSEINDGTRMSIDPSVRFETNRIAFGHSSGSGLRHNEIEPLIDQSSANTLEVGNAYHTADVDNDGASFTATPGSLFLIAGSDFDVQALSNFIVEADAFAIGVEGSLLGVGVNVLIATQDVIIDGPVAADTIDFALEVAGTSAIGNELARVGLSNAELAYITANRLIYRVGGFLTGGGHEVSVDGVTLAATANIAEFVIRATTASAGELDRVLFENNASDFAGTLTVENDDPDTGYLGDVDILIDVPVSAQGDMSFFAQRDIIISAPTLALAGLASGDSLQLAAGRDVQIASDITLAGADLDITPDYPFADLPVGDGQLVVTPSGGTLTWQTGGGDIDINGPTSIGAGSLNLLSTDGSVWIEGVEGPGGLDIDAGSGSVILADAIGSSTALASLGVTATTVYLDSDIATSGSLSIGDALVLGGDVMLSAGDDLALSGTVEGDGEGDPIVTLTSDGDVSIGGNVGASEPLESLIIAGAQWATLFGTVDVVQNLSLTAESIELDGAIDGAGTLMLQPVSVDRAINLGGMSSELLEATSLYLDSTELALIGSSFSQITVGRVDGQHVITTDAAAFPSTLSLQTPAGGSITIGSTLGDTGLDVDGGATLTGSGATTYLDADIIVDGPLVIDDSVVLGADITIDTGSGGSITFLGPINGDFTLRLLTGGDVIFSGAVGSGQRLSGLTVLGASNVSLNGAVSVADVAMTYSGDLVSVSDALDVDSLFISPSANSAEVFGTVAGRSGEQAAYVVDGPDGDPNFVINGYRIGQAIAVVLPQVFPEITDDPVMPGGQALRLPVLNAWLPTTPSLPVGDPTESQFSSFGNEELWGPAGEAKQ